MADESGNLGSRYMRGALAGILEPNINRVVSGAWLVRFPVDQLPSDPAYEVYHGSLRGPGGQVLVYINDKQWGVILNGRRSEYAPKIPMYVHKGEEISFHWTVTSGTAPQVWLWLRLPEVGRI